MRVRRLIVAAALVLTSAPAVAVAAPAADAAEPCTPTITMGQPFQDPGGFVIFPASYSLCESSKVTIKFRDRDGDPGWGAGAGTAPAGPGSTYAGTCHPDGKDHRWVAYATVKTATGGTLLVESPKVYINAGAVTGNCAPYPPAGPCTPSLTMGKAFQDSAGWVWFPTDYKSCETTRVLVKVRDRDGAVGNHLNTYGTGPYRVGAGASGTVYSAWCNADGAAHRYAAYSTMKTPDGGTLILRNDEIFFKSTPVTSCGALTVPS